MTQLTLDQRLIQEGKAFVIVNAVNNRLLSDGVIDNGGPLQASHE